jgi:hypothetical protein
MIIIYFVLLLLTLASFYNFSDFMHRFSIIYKIIFFVSIIISSYLFLTVKNNPGIVIRNDEVIIDTTEISSFRIENKDNYSTTREQFDKQIFCEKCNLYVV